MHIDFLLPIFEYNNAKDAIIWHDEATSYGELIRQIHEATSSFEAKALSAGSVVSVEAEFSPMAVAIMLALIERGCVVVPISNSSGVDKAKFLEIANVEFRCHVTANDVLDIESTKTVADHPLLRHLRSKQHPGLVLFSSGSTGKTKAALHDFVLVLEKFKIKRHALRTLTFLLFDHIGGVNTLLYTLANAGCAITVEDRTPDGVAKAVEMHRVQLLPTSPTFLNLMLISEVGKRYDLSSLLTVTYGTEVMPASTLQRFHEAFPTVRLLQTYGLSEVGILRSKSKSSDSLWVKVGGEGFETRVVDGKLEIKAASAMLGYLNAPSPFTEDGWLRTGDAVSVEGDYFRFLGRESEIINVGGEKVYPAEIESVLQMLDGVEEVAVYGEPHAIMGEIVMASFKLQTNEGLSELRTRVRAHCAGRLAPFKIPQKVNIHTNNLHNTRFKKMRRM